MTDICPKVMAYGPCGGVHEDGTCELGDRRCTFVDGPTIRWSGVPRPMSTVLPTTPFVVADIPAVACDTAAFRAAAAVLAGNVDAGLFGDHGQARVQLPPVLRAQACMAEGLAPWAGLNCRDRNRVALEIELVGLREVGVAGVHCVTGDHTETGHRPDALPVFDLDATRLASLACGLGLVTSVGESPLTPPVDQRPARLVEKAKAGAAVCFVNHTGSARVVADFVAAAGTLGAGHLAYIACIPMVTSRASAAEINRFTGLALPPGLLQRVDEAADPWQVGVAEALALAEAMLAVPGVVGIDLSGVPGDGEELDLARAMAAVGERLR